MRKRKYEMLPPVPKPRPYIGESIVDWSVFLPPPKVLVRAEPGFPNPLHAAGDETEPFWDESTGDEWLSPADIAAKYGLKAESLRKSLERFRKKNPHLQNTGWLQIRDRGQRKPEYLYRLASVCHVVFKAAEKNVR